MKILRAFTLVEVLLALAISALVMVGACALMFNMANVIRHFENGTPFDMHVNGVENFLKNSLANSAFPSGMDYTLTGSASSQKTAAIYAGNPPDSTLAQKSKICFGILDDKPLYLSKRGFSPEKIAWLDFREGEGLYLLWMFVKNENPNSFTDERSVYEIQLSPYVEKFEYIYIDSDGRWLSEDDMDNLSSSSIAAGTLPNYLKLYFKRGAETFERYVPLARVMDSKFAPAGSSTSASNSRGANSNGAKGQGGSQGGSQGGGRGNNGGSGGGRGGAR